MKGLAQERHEEGKWQEGLCYTQHFLKTVSAKALNQLQDVKSPHTALALESSPTCACAVLGFTVLSLNPRAVNTGRHSVCALNR